MKMGLGKDLRGSNTMESCAQVSSTKQVACPSHQSGPHQEFSITKICYVVCMWAAAGLWSKQQHLMWDEWPKSVPASALLSKVRWLDRSYGEVSVILHFLQGKRRPETLFSGPAIISDFKGFFTYHPKYQDHWNITTGFWWVASILSSVLIIK